MPPKTKFTKEMILEAAFELTRESGIESVNARSLASKLRCSTHPIMYCFDTVDDIRREVRARAERYQTEYIEAEQGNGLSMPQIGANYVRFAAEEKHLFRLLFQSDHFSKQTFLELVGDESVKPLIEHIQERYKLSEAEAKDEFTARFMLVHGMASMLANNSMVYDEALVARLLQRQFPDNEEEKK